MRFEPSLKGMSQLQAQRMKRANHYMYSGFFITYMGSALGTSPGRLVETDAGGNIIHEWPEDVKGLVGQPVEGAHRETKYLRDDSLTFLESNSAPTA